MALSTRKTLPNKRDCPQRCCSCQRCPVTFSHASKVVGHLRTVHGRAAVMRGKTFSQPKHMRLHGECEHSVPADWPSGDYLCYHHHPATPHCTQFPLYLSMSAGFGYTSLVAAACGATLPLPLCHSASSQRSRASPDG